MYPGIVKVVRSNGQLRIMKISDISKALEYAVKMLEIPQEYRMDRLLRTNNVTRRRKRSLATLLVRFHRTSRTNAKITKFGSPTFMKWKIRGNFKTLSNLINLDNGNITKLNVFVRNNKELLSYRMRHGNIREIHGDLYLRNIFLSNGKSIL